MRIVLLFCVLFMTGLMTASSCLAVRVDIWQTGMTRSQVWALAEKKDIPLAPEGRFHAATTYQERFVDPAARVLYCRGTLWGQMGTIYLYLVEQAAGEPVVGSIEVRYQQGYNSAVSERIVRSLTRTYGRAATSISSWQRLAQWHTEDLDIRLSVRKNSLRLRYTDLTLQPEK